MVFAMVIVEPVLYSLGVEECFEILFDYDKECIKNVRNCPNKRLRQPALSMISVRLLNCVIGCWFCAGLPIGIPSGPPVIHCASTLGRQKNAELHMHNEDKRKGFSIFPHSFANQRGSLHSNNNSEMRLRLSDLQPRISHLVNKNNHKTLTKTCLLY